MASTCFQQKRNSIPSASLSDSASDDDLPSVKKIIARAGRAQKKPAIDLTGDNADHDFVAVPSLSTPVLQPLPASSFRAPIHTPSSRRVAAFSGVKKSPFKNRPPWSRFKTPPPPPQHRLHAALNNDKPIPAASELSSENARALVGQSADSPEIAETPPSACNGPYCEKDDYGGDDRHDTGSVETDNLQRAAQTESIINSDEAPLSIAESSEQTLAPIIASGPSLPDLGEDSSAVVDISKFRTAKIVDKRSSLSGIEYMCELEPLWLAADSVGKTQMGGVHIRGYENGLIRTGRVATLRVATKRKHSQMEPAAFSLYPAPSSGWLFSCRV